MDNATQYQFELLDVAKLLLQKQGINQGYWTIGAGFNIAATIAGPTPDQSRPSMIVSVDKLILTRAEQLGPLTIDAAVLAKS